MKTNYEKEFDSVKSFRIIKEKLAKYLINMTLDEQKEFLKKVREGTIKIA
jgi:hypothetical protein